MGGDRFNAGEWTTTTNGGPGDGRSSSSTAFGRSSNSSALPSLSVVSHGLSPEPSNFATTTTTIAGPSCIPSSGSSSTVPLFAATNDSAGLLSSPTTLIWQPSCIVLDGSSSALPPLPRLPGAAQVAPSVSLGPRSSGHRRARSELVDSGYTILGVSSASFPTPPPPPTGSGLFSLPVTTELTLSVSLVPEFSSRISGHRRARSEIVGPSDYTEFEGSENDEDVLSMYLDTTKLSSLCGDIGGSSYSGESSGMAATPSEHAPVPLLLTANAGSSSGARLSTDSSNSELLGAAVSSPEHASMNYIQMANEGSSSGERPRIGHRKSQSADDIVFATQGGSPPAPAPNLPEQKKGITDAMLAQIAAVDPKRAKRILSNRISAARSKERKKKYVIDLHHRFENLQQLVSTLSAQVANAKRDTDALCADHKELQLSVENMKIEMQMKEALTDKLSAELKRLKLATGETESPVQNFIGGNQGIYAQGMQPIMLAAPGEWQLNWSQMNPHTQHSQSDLPLLTANLQQISPLQSQTPLLAFPDWQMHHESIRMIERMALVKQEEDQTMEDGSAQGK